MNNVLALLLMTLMIGSVAGCQKSAKDHNMSPEEHQKM
jgi:hypothetical protein